MSVWSGRESQYSNQKSNIKNNSNNNRSSNNSNNKNSNKSSKNNNSDNSISNKNSNSKNNNSTMQERATTRTATTAAATTTATASTTPPPPRQVSEARLSLLFTVMRGNFSSSDGSAPEADPEYAGSCPPGATADDTVLCAGYVWHLEFHVRDEGSGLRDVRVEGAAGDARPGEPRTDGQRTRFLSFSQSNYDVLSAYWSGCSGKSQDLERKLFYLFFFLNEITLKS